MASSTLRAGYGPWLSVLARPVSRRGLRQARRPRAITRLGTETLVAFAANVPATQIEDFFCAATPH
jgi:hypothetical protein